MEQFAGKSIFKGTAIGRILFYSKNQQQVKRDKVEEVEAEIARYEEAKAKAIEQLGKLHDKAVNEVGEANAMIFEVHAMMLEDEDYNDSIYNIIRSDEVNAEFAVATTGDNFAVMFAEMDDEYFKARAADVKDISERIIGVLSGTDAGGEIGDEPVIIVAEDLAPSETVKMDKTKLLAFVTRLGSSNSHTAILA
ncbi:MAG: phosphoenolpyruvate--protein phosphotransferase, partial [Lachnospiraceae bacterium]|nr:phosphoenolpyruvate--protein phosphotransferase [Lachnospiraceae bacterium]